MQVDLFEDYDALKELEADWKSVYLADPEAQFFLSWAWLSQLLAQESSGWCVLAARTDGEGSGYVSFFPLWLRRRMSKSRQALCKEVHMAGSMAWADFTGFICDPKHEADALASLADRLKQMHWTALHLRHFHASERRRGLFLPCFDEATYVTTNRRRVGPPQSINNEICPYVDLPGDFESYLTQRVSTNTRQKMRRHMRRLDHSAELRITHSTPETHSRDVDSLIGYWRSAWAHRKGRKLDRLASKYRDILLSGLEAGLMFMPVLWRGEQPVGALGHFVDWEKKALLYFIAGRDDTCTTPPPGFVLHTYSIRWAIERGLRTYEFLRGNERYKYSYGVSERRIHNLIVRALRRTPDGTPEDHITTRSSDDRGGGSLNDTDLTCDQILDAYADDHAALRRYARMLYLSDRFIESCEFCKRLIGRSPDDASAWRQLGKAQLAMDQFVEAERSFRSAIELNPTISAHYYLARALQGQEREVDAASEFRALLNLLPRGEREKKQQERARRYAMRNRG